MHLENSRPIRLHDYQEVFKSRDLDETRSYIAKFIKSHDLDLLRKGQSLNARIGKTDFGDISFFYIQHGADVHVYPGKLETIYLLQMPINPGGHVRVNNTEIRITGGMAYIVSPDLDLEMRFPKTCGHVIATIQKARLENFLEHHIERKLDVPLVFAPEIRLPSPFHHELTSLIIHLIKQLNHPNATFRNALVGPQAQSLLLSTMLLTLQHNYTTELKSEASSPKPYYIRKAIAYIKANAELPLSPEDVAQQACISRRAIYAGFRAHLNTTPMAYIRKVKMTHIRDELRRGDPSKISVSDIALKYGITHFGNLAANYKRTFGELPSDTLRRPVPV